MSHATKLMMNQVKRLTATAEKLIAQLCNGAMSVQAMQNLMRIIGAISGINPTAATTLINTVMHVMQSQVNALSSTTPNAKVNLLANCLSVMRESPQIPQVELAGLTTKLNSQLNKDNNVTSVLPITARPIRPPTQITGSQSTKSSGSSNTRQLNKLISVLPPITARPIRPPTDITDIRSIRPSISLDIKQPVALDDILLQL